MFDRIAKHYDFLNHFLSLGIDRRWRKRAVDELEQTKPQRVLDVATGTADLAVEIARRLQPEAVIGVDIAENMLSIGRQKIQSRQLSATVDLRSGDSENLLFPDQSFDAVTVAFGVRNFENLEKGLREMQRVLRPGGKLVVLEFSKPRIFPFRQIYNAYFKYLLPTIGRLTSKDPKAYRYLYESVQTFPDGKDFLNTLAKTGFQSSQCKPLTLGVCSIYTATR